MKTTKKRKNKKNDKTTNSMGNTRNSNQHNNLRNTPRQQENERMRNNTPKLRTTPMQSRKHTNTIRKRPIPRPIHTMPANQQNNMEALTQLSLEIQELKADTIILQHKIQQLEKKQNEILKMQQMR